MREANLEKKFRLAVERVGGLAPKWVSPGSRGVPDRIVILPGGRVAFVELKAPGKQLQPLQRKWMKTLRSLGHQVYKIDSEDDIERFIKEVVGD